MARWVEVNEGTNDSTNQPSEGVSAVSGQTAGQPASILRAPGSCIAELLSKRSLHCLYNSLFLRNVSCWAPLR